jgi:hypothetical protein
MMLRKKKSWKELPSQARRNIMAGIVGMNALQDCDDTVRFAAQRAIDRRKRVEKKNRDQRQERKTP